MNRFAIQQNAFAACEDMRGPFTASDRKEPVFCPKPRRLGQLTGADPVRPIRWHVSHQGDLSDSKTGSELLDIFLTKGSYDVEQGPIASSPPFFTGSPPSRAANPVVHDARFGEEKPPVPLSIPSGSPMSPRKGCVRNKFGLKPAAVRVEGFDCLDRDRRSISAVA